MATFTIYQPDFIVYEVQMRDKHGKWSVCTTIHSLQYALATAQENSNLYSTVVYRIVKNDLRSNDPNRDNQYLRPSVIWVSKPTFSNNVDYWKP